MWKLLVDKKDPKQQCQYLLASVWKVLRHIKYWTKDFSESQLELLQHLFEQFNDVIYLKMSIIRVCLKNCNIQIQVLILLLMRHSYKVCVNPQQIFSEKFLVFIEID